MPRGAVSKSSIAKLFQNGRSQAVRLPRASFRFPGTEVRVRKVGRRVVLEPMVTDPQGWFEVEASM